MVSTTEESSASLSLARCSRSRTDDTGCVCIAIAMPIACRGHVMILSGNRERPCSSDVFVRISRRNRTFPEDIDRLHF
ncbi:hypothetical protein PHMEG_00040732 [Phytophthora megakarya]|uniref:Uncharacterized protein n=1 Tax=Phytophthora megakarya TaxID=4795 RepID=A0A225UCZ6_9STRA|nr:hypothetical protein PHMEG_00040732 [Phytophthora megakarya]